LWLGNGEQTIVIPGPGINPYIQDDGEIFLRLEIFFHNKEVDPQIITHVFYFGAGCAQAMQVSRIEKLLMRFFPGSSIAVESDLLGSALALCGSDPGFVGILGTGSNACFFDGKKIRRQMVSLGFWLGDEGSGGYIGKRIFTDWLKNRLPAWFESELTEIFPIAKNQALEFIYSDKSPNKTLASLARLAFEHRHTEYSEGIIRQSIDAYFKEISPILEQESGNTGFYFTGSVAGELRKELREKVEDLGYTLVKILPKPSEALFQYHLKSA
jgi:N-acetylglucosamine kinase-like BadF-type ATPase